MESKLRVCAVCRSRYEFCPRCKEDNNKPLWYFTFCGENCRDIYDITSKFENNQINASKAKIRLDKLDLSKLNNFGESYKSSISKIMRFVSTETKNNIEILKEIETIEEDIKEEKSIKKPRSRKAKNNVEE